MPFGLHVVAAHVHAGMLLAPPSQQLPHDRDSRCRKLPHQGWRSSGFDEGVAAAALAAAARAPVAAGWVGTAAAALGCTGLGAKGWKV